jgi:crotonobetainyl-CoA:carnitine CoA-transferase CaiB-like acyl-CoA transferase
MNILKGTRILDLSRLIPGSFCTLILADLGAEVIKVEDPITGDYERHIPPFIKNVGSRFLLLNRNKKSLTLNLKSNKGREIFFNLAKKADIIVENFRPGKMDELGIGYERIHELSPSLIYCSLSSYGQEGPYRNEVGHDINILAVSGVLDLMRGKGGKPVIPGVQLADSLTGMYSAIAILGALLHREKTGRGQFLDISMLDGVVSWLFNSARFYIAGLTSPKSGKERLSGGLPNYNLYKTKDGKYIALGALEKKFINTLLAHLGREDLIDSESGVTSTTVGGQRQRRIGAFLRKIFLMKTGDEWLRELRGLNICVTPVNTLEEGLNHPQVLHRKMVVEVEDSILGKIKQIGIPLKFSETPGEIRNIGPQLGEHSIEILKSIGYNQKEIDDFIQEKVTTPKIY